ncbi:MAG: TIGR03915 family putative DNA repair protein [Defluviitaleaceae bacterium]|nr:TIGR03915 family putative DNA repair protein [Defluviitaleaceae bacterium]
MSYRTDIAYLYDGTFHGLLCCVHESYYKKELPFAIYNYEEEQETLFTPKEILTDPDVAGRVETSIVNKISKDALQLVYLCFLSSMKGRELAILHFLRLGYKVGSPVIDMLTHDAVAKVTNAVRNVQGEAHVYKGFLRFSEFDGALAAVFEPKNFILPIVAPHFCDRMPDEHFLIYDKTHKHAFIQQNGEKSLIPIDNLELPEACTEEKMYRELWKRFYDTIAIEGRKNPKLRMGNLPKRFWSHLTEFTETKTTM